MDTKKKKRMLDDMDEKKPGRLQKAAAMRLAQKYEGKNSGKNKGNGFGGKPGLASLKRGVEKMIVFSQHAGNEKEPKG